LGDVDLDDVDFDPSKLGRPVDDPKLNPADITSIHARKILTLAHVITSARSRLVPRRKSMSARYNTSTPASAAGAKSSPHRKSEGPLADSPSPLSNGGASAVAVTHRYGQGWRIPS
jgi:hypothetical protein